MFLNPDETPYRRLYLVFALDKIRGFLAKLKKGKLTARDFAAVEVKYNDPKLSFFTMLKNTVHCEVVSKESGRHPVFFVTESARLKNEKIDHKSIKFEICEER